MSDAFTMQVKGLDQLRQNMLQLPKKFDRRILQAGLLYGARAIAEEAKSIAPVLDSKYKGDKRRKAGTLRRNIRARAIFPQPGMTASVIVGVRRLSAKQILAFKSAAGKKGAANPDDPYYAQWVEFKTRRSNLRPQPFLRPAFSRRKEEALARFQARLAQRMVLALSEMRR